MRSVSFPRGISVRRTIVAIIACKMKNWLREIPAVVRTSRETGEKNTSPLSREVRSSASVFSFAFILIHHLPLFISRLIAPIAAKQGAHSRLKIIKA